MRELIARTWCDACADEDQREPGETVRPNHGRRSLDLCEAHQAALLAPLERLLGEYGATEAKRGPGRPRKASGSPSATQELPGPQDGSWPCPLCDVVKPNDHQLKSHAGKAHGVATLAELFGSSCPLCGFQGRGRLGQHTQAAHGLNVAQAAAAGARKAS